MLHVDPALEWRGGQAQLAALLRARPGDGWAGAPSGELARRVRPPDVALRPNMDLRNLATLRAGAEGYDLVAVHSSHAHTAALGVSLPVVVHRRNHRPPTNVWRYRRAAATVAVSAFVAGLCRAAGVPRVSVVYDGADAPARLPRPASPVPEYLVPAALVAHKGHAALLDAFVGLQAELVFAGDGPLRASLSARAERLGVPVRFLGGIDDLEPWFARAHAVVLPSREEAAGSVLIEAMARGVPVVASAVGGIPELLGDVGLAVPLDDIGAWQRALRVAPGADRLRIQAYAQRFSVAAMVAGTEAVYAEALAR